MQLVYASFDRGSPFPVYDGVAAVFTREHWSSNDVYVASKRWEALARSVLGGEQPTAPQLLAAAYGNRYLLFIAVNASSSVSSSVVVLEAAPIGCLEGTALESSVDAKIPLLGPAQTLSVTPNAQFFFASTGRFYWQLLSMNRLAEVCTQLENHPDDVFLQNFTSACNPSDAKLVPRPPVLSDFLLVRWHPNAFWPIVIVAYTIGPCRSRLRVRQTRIVRASMMKVSPLSTMDTLVPTSSTVKSVRRVASARLD